MFEYLLEVTDLKQYMSCPRVVFYRYCLPAIRPLTSLMEEGIRQHEKEEEREERRSLRNYDVREGERTFNLRLQSQHLGLIGLIDLVIVTPEKEGIVVEYKYSEQKAGAHFRLQLAAYALLVEEAWGITVTSGYIYSIPRRQAERIPITLTLKKRVSTVNTAIRALVEQEIMPLPPQRQSRCLSCEFRRFCNDIL